MADLLHKRFPGLELYDLELRGGRQSLITVFIDRPGGVDLDTCAAVSAALDGLREQHALEVSSPGLERRLRRPDHFRGVVGETVTLRTTVPRDGRSAFRGVLVEADADGVTVAVDEGSELRAKYSEIARANLVYRFEKQRRPA